MNQVFCLASEVVIFASESWTISVTALLEHAQQGSIVSWRWLLVSRKMSDPFRKPNSVPNWFIWIKFPKIERKQSRHVLWAFSPFPVIYTQCIFMYINAFRLQDSCIACTPVRPYPTTRRIWGLGPHGPREMQDGVQKKPQKWFMQRWEKWRLVCDIDSPNKIENR